MEVSANLLNKLSNVKKVDAIIIGQGLAGTCMALTLQKRGKKVCVIDPQLHHDRSFVNASRSAAGLFNPITGRKMVKTWLADSLFDQLAHFYPEYETEWNRKFYHKLPIYRPFQTVEDQNDWVGADMDPLYSRYVEKVYTEPIELPGYVDPYGGLLLNQCGYLDIPTFLDAALDHFNSDQSFINGTADHYRLEFSDKGVIYDDGSNKLHARWVIYCTGVDQGKNGFWNSLKFRPVKGEWLTLDISFDPNYILNRGVFMIPREGSVRVGSTYDHSSLDGIVTAKAQKEIIDRMRKIYSGDYRILDQRAGVRPATYDRKPFVGVHPEHSYVAILNGLGAKGVTLAPYFADHLASHLLDKEPLMPEVDVLRCF